MRIVHLDALQSFSAVNLLRDPGAVPGPVVVPQCAQIVVHMQIDDGKVASMVMYGRYSGSFAGNQGQANALTTGLLTGPQYTALAAFLATTTTNGSVTIRDVNTANQPIISPSVGGNAGTSASPALPNEVALAVTLRTAKTGRSFRGRIYFPGFATNALGTGNTAAAAAVTALQNWASTITSVMQGQGYTFALGLKHRAAYTSPTTGRVFPERLATSEPVTLVTVRDNHWDSQRRRGLK